MIFQMYDVKQFVPECFVDSRLIQIILNSSKGPNHAHGVGKVLNKLEMDLLKYPAIGIIDQDPGKGAKPTIWSNYQPQLLEENLINFGLGVFKHQSKNHLVIEIMPEIEKWILEACNESAVNPQEYGLPQNLHDLNMITKSINIHTNKEFTNLILKLLELNSPRLIKLKEILLRYSNYKIPLERRV